MANKKSEKKLSEEQIREKTLKILDTKENQRFSGPQKSEKIFAEKKESEKEIKREEQKLKTEITKIINERSTRKKPKLGISINVHKNPNAQKQLAEKGIKINLGGILGSLFSRKNVVKGTGKVLKTADKMLKEDINDYSEFGSNEKNGVKVEHGFRMRFLDDDKEKNAKEKDHEKEKLKKWKKK